MNPCAVSLKRSQVEGFVDLPSEWWRGWRVRQGKLHGPGGMTFTATTLAAMWRRFTDARDYSETGRHSETQDAATSP